MLHAGPKPSTTPGWLNQYQFPHYKGKTISPNARHLEAPLSIACSRASCNPACPSELPANLHLPSLKLNLNPEQALEAKELKKRGLGKWALCCSRRNTHSEDGRNSHQSSQIPFSVQKGGSKAQVVNRVRLQCSIAWGQELCKLLLFRRFCVRQQRRRAIAGPSLPAKTTRFPVLGPGLSISHRLYIHAHT